MNASARAPETATTPADAPDEIARDRITGVVLAGGLGRRMSADGRGVDKGLQPFRGRPMVAHVLERLAPQVGRVLVNANRNPDAYRAFGHPVVPDAIEGFAGPLAGLHAGMCAAVTDWVVTAPCDTPFLPPDLVARLADAAQRSGADIAIASAAGREHPVFMLARRTLLPGLEAFLARGERKVDLWYASLRTAIAEFPDEQAFVNLNTLDELRSSEAR